MRTNFKLEIKQDPAFCALIASVAGMGFSLPFARVFLLISFILALVDTIRGRRKFIVPTTAKLWFLYIITAVITSVVALWLFDSTTDKTDPAGGIRKITKLVWFMAIPLVPTLVDTSEKFFKLLHAFVIGAVIGGSLIISNIFGAALIIGLPNPDLPGSGVATIERLTDAIGVTDCLRKWAANRWWPVTYNDALAKLTGMGEAQRAMTGFIVSICLFLRERRRNLETKIPISAIILALAMLVGMKRGTWVSAGIVLIPIFLINLGLRKSLMILLIAAGCVASLPATRQRIFDIPREFNTKKPGRAGMWKWIVAPCREKYPIGTGFRALTEDEMHDFFWRTEKGQNHVHNNSLQILIELGLQGLAIYLLWMTVAFVDAARLRFIKKTSDKLKFSEPDRPVQSIPLLLLSALFLNGMIEYNFADGEIVLIYGLAMGLAACRKNKAPSAI